MRITLVYHKTKVHIHFVISFSRYSRRILVIMIFYVAWISKFIQTAVFMIFMTGIIFKRILKKDYMAEKSWIILLSNG